VSSMATEKHWFEWCAAHQTATYATVLCYLYTKQLFLGHVGLCPIYKSLWPSVLPEPLCMLAKSAPQHWLKQGSCGLDCLHVPFPPFFPCRTVPSVPLSYLALCCSVCGCMQRSTCSRVWAWTSTRQRCTTACQCLQDGEWSGAGGKGWWEEANNCLYVPALPMGWCGWVGAGLCGAGGGGAQPYACLDIVAGSGLLAAVALQSWLSAAGIGNSSNHSRVCQGCWQKFPRSHACGAARASRRCTGATKYHAHFCCSPNRHYV
jgi:hypothetical protein